MHLISWILPWSYNVFTGWSNCAHGKSQNWQKNWYIMRTPERVQFASGSKSISKSYVNSNALKVVYSSVLGLRNVNWHSCLSSVLWDQWNFAFVINNYFCHNLSVSLALVFKWEHDIEFIDSNSWISNVIFTLNIFDTKN